MELDEWQKQVMQTKGNIAVRAGRQVGKSFVISRKAAQYATNNRDKLVMIVAATERQAYLLFEKVLEHLYSEHKSLIKMGKDRPTKSKITLKNGSKIYCLPTGLTGYGIRGFTVDLLIVDEAAFVPDEVFNAVTPMLAITRGNLILLSTPMGKDNYFYRSFNDETFTTFHVSSLDCPRRNDAFLEQERQRMTKLQFAQEYLGEFIDDLMQFFPDDLIKSCMVDEITYAHQGENNLGVDVARMGEDETALATTNYYNDRLKLIDLQVTTKTRLTDTIRLIKHQDLIYNYKKIYIDTTGVGWGVYDPLLEDSQTKSKVVAIENAKKSLDRDDEQRKKLMKEDLYNNLRVLMEKKILVLPKDPKVFQSLKSIQFEYTGEGKLKIFGNYSHICEALIRAAWSLKQKGLNLWVSYN